MITKKRMEEIGELVRLWEHDERVKEEYPMTTSGTLSPTTQVHDPKRFLRAAKEMGISPKELAEYLEQHFLELSDEMLAEADLPEEELRDAFAAEDDLRKDVENK